MREAFKTFTSNLATADLFENILNWPSHFLISCHRHCLLATDVSFILSELQLISLLLQCLSEAQGASRKSQFVSRCEGWDGGLGSLKNLICVELSVHLNKIFELSGESHNWRLFNLFSRHQLINGFSSQRNLFSSAMSVGKIYSKSIPISRDSGLFFCRPKHK